MSKPFFDGSRFGSGDWQNGFESEMVLRDDGSIDVIVAFHTLQQGPPSIVHGGAIATMIDEAMTAVAFEVVKRPAFTVELNIRYIAPLFIKDQAIFSAVVESVERRKITIRCTVVDSEAQIVAEADGLFIAIQESSS